MKSDRPVYEHSQIAWSIVGFVPVCLIGFWLATRGIPATAPAVMLYAGATVLLLTPLLFGWLSIRIDHERLRWAFGVGLIRFSVPLREIESIEPTKTSFFTGKGIRFTRRGWLYNVSGSAVILIRRSNGRSFLLGTDEPERLAAALERSRVRR